MGIVGRTLGSIRRLVSPPVFEVEIRRGVARARRGDVPGGFLAGLSDVARDLALPDGEIYGVRGRHGLTLEFSAAIPQHAHQRLRNVLALHRHQIKSG